MNVSMHVKGFDEAMTRIGAFASADRKSMMRDIGTEIVSQTEARFERAEDPEGRTWKAWAAATRNFVARHAPGSRILWRSGAGGGRLKNRISSAVVSSDTVEVGSDVPYAAIHQLGGKAGRGGKVTIPARPYLGLSNENIEDIEGLVVDWIGDTL